MPFSNPRFDSLVSEATKLPEYSGWSQNDIGKNILDVLTSKDSGRSIRLTSALSKIPAYSGWGNDEIVENIGSFFETKPWTVEGMAESAEPVMIKGIPQPIPESPLPGLGGYGYEPTSMSQATAPEPKKQEIGAYELSKVGIPDAPMSPEGKAYESAISKMAGQGYSAAAKGVATYPIEISEQIGKAATFLPGGGGKEARKEITAFHEKAKKASIETLGLDKASDFFKLNENDQKALEESGLTGQIAAEGASLILQLPMYMGGAGAAGKVLPTAERLTSRAAPILERALPKLAKKFTPEVAERIIGTVANIIGMTGVTTTQIAGEKGYKEAVKELPKSALVASTMSVAEPAGMIAPKVLKPVARTAGAAAGGFFGTLIGGGSLKDAIRAGILFGTMHGTSEMGRIKPWEAKNAEGAGREVEKGGPGEGTEGEEGGGLRVGNAPENRMGAAAGEEARPNGVEGTETTRSMAAIDELTGLESPNITKAKIEVEKRAGKRPVLFIDIDNFKDINDTYGHDAGDAILNQVGGVIRKHFGEIGENGRFGGEELSSIHNAPATPEQLKAFLDDISATVKTPDGQPVTVSAGYAIGKVQTQKGPSRLAADKKLYEAKEGGRNQISVDLGPEKAYTIKGTEVGEKSYVTNQNLRRLETGARQLLASARLSSPADRSALEGAIQVVQRIKAGEQPAAERGAVPTEEPATVAEEKPARTPAQDFSQENIATNREYFQNSYFSGLHSELYNDLKNGWRDRNRVFHPGQQKGWLDDYNLLTENRKLTGRSRYSKGGMRLEPSKNAKQWMQNKVDLAGEYADEGAFEEIGLKRPEHIDDIRGFLENSMPPRTMKKQGSFEDWAEKYQWKSFDETMGRRPEDIASEEDKRMEEEGRQEEVPDFRQKRERQPGEDEEEPFPTGRGEETIGTGTSGSIRIGPGAKEPEQTALPGFEETRKPWEIEQERREQERKTKQREKPLEGTMFDQEEMEARATEQESFFDDLMPTGRKEETIGGEQGGSVRVGPGAKEEQQKGNTVGGDMSFKTRFENEMKYWLRSRGLKPEKMHKLDRQRLFKISETMGKLEYLALDWKRAVKEVYGEKELTDREQYKLDLVLKGKADFSAINKKLWKPLRAYRNEINNLSKAIRDSGMLSEKGMEDFDVDTWVNRSYRVFNEKGWWKKVPQETVDAVKRLIRTEARDKGIDMTDSEVQGEVDVLLFKHSNAQDVMSAVGKLGSVARGILQSRKEIPFEIRALWGEYQRVDVNAAQSIAKASHMLANYEYLKELRETGLKEGFFQEKPDVVKGVSYSTEIASEGSKTLEPLAGLYTSKEIAREINDAFSPKAVEAWLRLYMKGIGASRISKTVLSPVTHIRNVTGNALIAIANGDVNPTSFGKAFNLVYSDFRGKSNAEQRQTLLYLKRKGIINESANLGELRDTMRDAAQTNFDIMFSGGFNRFVKGIYQGSMKLYSLEDDLWKIAAFLNNKKRYQKADPSFTDDQVAETIRNTYPTYSEVPRITRFLRRFPVVGTFVSWPSEIIRTSYGVFRQAAKDMKSDNPGIRAIGYQRAVGILAAATIPAMIATAGGLISGIMPGSKKEKSLREFMPEWSKNSELFLMSKINNGNINYIDMGYTDPYSYLKKPIIALMSGKDWKKAYWEAIAEIYKPFFSEDILTSKLMDVARNRKTTGGLVYNKNDNPAKIGFDVALHFMEALEPGLVTSARRVSKAEAGERTATGQPYSTTKELVSLGTGLRISEVDVKKSLEFSARKYNSEKQDLTALYRKKNQEPDLSGPEKSLKEKIEAAKILGMSQEEIAASLKAGGVSSLAMAFIETDFKKRIEESLKNLKPGEKPNRQDARELWKELKGMGYKSDFGKFWSRYNAISISKLGSEDLKLLSRTKNEKEKAEIIDRIVSQKSGISEEKKADMKRRLKRNARLYYELIETEEGEE